MGQASSSTKKKIRNAEISFKNCEAKMCHDTKKSLDKLFGEMLKEKKAAKEKMETSTLHILKRGQTYKSEIKKINNKYEKLLAKEDLKCLVNNCPHDVENLTRFYNEGLHEIKKDAEKQTKNAEKKLIVLKKKLTTAKDKTKIKNSIEKISFLVKALKKQDKYVHTLLTKLPTNPVRTVAVARKMLDTVDF